MDFDIKKYLNNKKYKNSENTPEFFITTIIKKYYSGITISQINYKKGIIFLKNISPQIKFKIFLHKEDVIREAEKKDVYIRDII